VQKRSIVEALNRYKEHNLAGRRKMKLCLLLENDSEKILDQSAVE